MTNQPPVRISIALACFNGEKHIEEQLESYAAQRNPPFELVASDDGSEDDTVSLIRKFSKRASFPVSILESEATTGITRNFERAIASCHGDAIALSDQDDIWHEEKLSFFALAFSDGEVGWHFRMRN